MTTRKDYLDRKVTFEQYYRSVNKAAGLSFVGHSILPRIEKALEAGDVHLNTIPLKEWDNMGANPILRQNLSRALKQHEDFLTQANIVCCLKQAARDAVKIDNWIKGKE